MTKTQKFYEWLLKTKNIHLHNNEKVVAAFDKIEPLIQKVSPVNN